MTWSHNYAPLGSLGVSALVATLPVVTLLGLLAFWHVRAQFAALAGLAVALSLAIGVYEMPSRLAGAAMAYGAAFGLFPIGWIILNAIFIYNLSVRTGQFAVLQQQVAGVSGDRRIQALLIAFGFGAFIEGAAGFEPRGDHRGADDRAWVSSAGGRPTGPDWQHGARGVRRPGHAAADPGANHESGRHGPECDGRSPVTHFSLIVPFWLVAAQVGWRGMLAVWPACLVTGLSFGILQFVVSNFHGPWLVDIVASVGSMGSLVVFMRWWRPRDRRESPAPSPERQPMAASGPPWRAWIPWVFLTVLVFVWGLPSVKSTLNGWFAPSLEVPWLHRAVVRVPPAVPQPEPEPAIFQGISCRRRGRRCSWPACCRGWPSAWGPGDWRRFTAAPCGASGFRC